MFNKKVFKKYLDGPLYSVSFNHQNQIICVDNLIIASIGGCSIGQKKNKIVFYYNELKLVYQKPKTNIELKYPIQDIEMGDEVIEKMKYCAKRQIIVSNSQDYCVLFKINEGKIELFQRFKTDYDPKKPYQYDGLFNYDGNILATGGEQGLIKFWQVTNEVKMLWEVTEDPSKINSLDFHIKYKLVLIAACENFQCKIINYENKQLIKRLTITDKNVYNLKFAAAYFSLDEQHILTINNPNQGASYLTVWKMSDNNVVPINTKQICDQPVTASCLSAEGMFLGIGGFNGSTKIVNLRYYDFESEHFDVEPAKALSIKSVAFAADSRFLISGSSDLSYYFLSNIRPEGWFSKITKAWVLAMFIIYIGHWILGKL